MQKFENMDVIAALEAIMHQNTAYYQSDFAYDIKMLREAARSDQPEDKLLLWLSRPSGTFCFGNGMCCSKIPKPTIHGNFAVNRPMTGFLPMRWS